MREKSSREIAQELPLFRKRGGGGEGEGAIGTITV